MKKLILAFALMLLLGSCGTGSYSVSSGKADEGMISFVSDTQMAVMVTIDNESFNVNTVKTKTWQKNRNIKKTAKNTIYLAPGQHNVTVFKKGEQIWQKPVYVSVQEHKIIKL